MRKKAAIAIAVFLLVGSVTFFMKKIQSPKNKDGHQNSPTVNVNSNVDLEKISEGTLLEPTSESTGKALAIDSHSPEGETIPKGTRKKTKGDQVTACTPAYEDMMEVINNPGVLESVAGKITDECLAELSKNVKNFDKNFKKMSEECTGKKEDYSAEQKNECMRLASLLRNAFAENEFQGMDPKDLPSPVLRAMITFRVLQGDDFTSSEADLDYYHRLVAEEQRLSPEHNLASLQSMLLGKLINSNPEKYQSDFYSTITDIEKKSPEAGLTSRILRYDSKIADPNFQSELDEFVQRYPQEPYGIYVKAAVMADKKDWAAADALMAKILAMPLSDKDRNFYDSERKRFASKQQGFTKRFSISVSM